MFTWEIVKFVLYFLLIAGGIGAISGSITRLVNVWEDIENRKLEQRAVSDAYECFDFARHAVSAADQIYSNGDSGVKLRYATDMVMTEFEIEESIARMYIESAIAMRNRKTDNVE